MEKKLQFSGRLKSTNERVTGTGLNQIDGEMVLFDGDKILGTIEPEGVRCYGITDRETYQNPITTEDDLYELQDKIVEMIISFCKERNLRDIETLHFSVDGLQESLDYDAWTAGTDSSLSAYGWEDDKYKKIGEVL
jgi:hypothetical protein